VAARGGRIIVPAFAVERTQQLVMLLHQLTDEKLIPELPVFVDSPLATKVTEVFRRHTEDWDKEACEFYHQGNDPFGWDRLKYTQTVQESKALNDLRVPSIVMGISVFALLVQGRHFSAFAGGVALAIMMIPTVTRTTEEMLATVPHAIREAALGLGVPKDFVSAYLWFSLAAAQGHKRAVRNRYELSGVMTPAQIAEARRLVRERRRTKQ